MDYSVQEKQLIVKMNVKRIDTVNAGEVEEEIMKIIGAYPEKDLILDFETLGYISSAGLRIMLRIRNITKKQVKLINVSSAVYEVLDVTGFVDILDVEEPERSIDNK